jgi:hypothetical protein
MSLITSAYESLVLLQFSSKFWEQLLLPTSLPYCQTQKWFKPRSVQPILVPLHIAKIRTEFKDFIEENLKKSSRNNKELNRTALKWF